MKHRHVGPPDVACSGCLDEANIRYNAEQRLRRAAGYVILIALIVAGMAVFAYYASR